MKRLSAAARRIVAHTRMSTVPKPSTFCTSSTSPGASTPTPPPQPSSTYFEPYSLSPMQRLVITPLHGLRALLDPRKGHEVAAFSDAINTTPLLKRKLQQALKKMQANPQGRKLLHEKKLISESALNPKLLLAECSPGTLGHEYAKFMTHHGYSADGRSVVKYTLDPDLAYVSARYRQVHDFWHVLTGLPPTVLGEVTLKAFEAAHLGLPSMAAGAALGAATLSPADLRTYLTHGLPWALRNGASISADLLSVNYEESVSVSVSVMQAQLGIKPYE